MPKLPPWLIKRTPKSRNIRKLRAVINDPGIHTVCESALCPNVGECYSRKTMTFMILGDRCTRNCRFCAVEKSAPGPVDGTEPKRIAEAAGKLGLKYVVVTSVTRDDLPDGGAEQFGRTVNKLRAGGLRVEVLIPDFKGSPDALKTVIDSKPDVLNHNVETVPRLYPGIRPQAEYKRSLELLRSAKKMENSILTKSGLMVGLGESPEEIFGVLKDLRAADCDLLTVGQYIAPSKKHAPVVEYLNPESFERIRKTGLEMGFKSVACGPFVRSSYQARELFGRSNV